jgi:anti-anti-sigma factor
MTEPLVRLRIDKVEPHRLRLRGEIDLASAPELERQLDHLGQAQDIVLDAADVTFIDSSGLRIVIAAHQSHQDAGTRLIVVNPSEVVSNVLSITGLTDHLDVEQLD